MAKNIEVPSFDFAAFYYPQLLDALVLYKRRECPEITDESDVEPFMQLLRSFALVGHLNNVLLDMIANESTLGTAQLAETIRNMLRLIDYELSPATPARSEIVLQLSRLFTSTTEIVPENAQFSTRRIDGETPIVYFEALTALSVDRTDLFDYAWAYLTSYTDVTLGANTGAPFSPWGSGVVPGAMLYFGNKSAMFNKLDVTVVSPADIAIGVWEFYDGDTRDTEPDDVADLGVGILQFELTTLLGTFNRAGATVRVWLNDTNEYQDVVSTWTGIKNIVQTGLLGQSTPALDPSAYTVGVEWQEMSDVSDGTDNLAQSGLVNFTLPQDQSKSWKKVAVNATAEAYYVRFRVIALNSLGNASTIGRVRMDTGSHFVIVDVVQGRTVLAETIGSSNGAKDQRFQMQRENMILESEVVRVDGEVWTRVRDFLESGPQDKHYKVELGENNRGFIVFGDGAEGKIPPVGQNNISADYRWGANDDGNAGAETINVDKTGLTYINRLWNPRAATGWGAAQSFDATTLARAKILGPSTLRTKDVAVGPDDVELLTEKFVDSLGSQPFSRAKAIEEGFGPKTIETIVVVRGGGVASPQQLSELDTYFNGDKTVIPNKPKHLVANQEVRSANYSEKLIDIDATVTAPPEVLPEAVENHLVSVIAPEAKLEDGVTYAWNFGAEVPRSRIVHEIFQADPRITKVALNDPTTDTLLTKRELPKAGVIRITII